MSTIALWKKAKWDSAGCEQRAPAGYTTWLEHPPKGYYTGIAILSRPIALRWVSAPAKVERVTTIWPSFTGVAHSTASTAKTGITVTLRPQQGRVYPKPARDHSQSEG